MHDDNPATVHGNFELTCCHRNTNPSYPEEAVLPGLSGTSNIAKVLGDLLYFEKS